MSTDKAEREARKRENKQAISTISSTAEGVFLCFWAFIVTCFKHPITAPALSIGGIVMVRLAFNFATATSVATVVPAPLPRTAPTEHKLGNFFGRTINATATSVHPTLKPGVEEYFSSVNGVTPTAQPSTVPGAINVSTMGFSAGQPVKSGLTKEQEDIINRSFDK